MIARSFARLLVAAAAVALCGTSLAQTATPVPDDAASQPVVEEPGRPAPVATAVANSPVTKLAKMIYRDFKRNNGWPEPFVAPDRQAVREPFVRMVAKGWVRQNTLGENHFEPDTGKLTYAGSLKVRKILLQGVPEHRTIYVPRALKPTETAARVDSVQQLAAETVASGELPAVLETDLPAPGWSADQVDNVSRRYRATMPDPRLPAPQGDASSSSGGGTP